MLMSRTPLGRMQSVEGVWLRSWPVLRRAASLYRRLLLRGTRLIIGLNYQPYASGAAGAGMSRANIIGPNATLIFEVEPISIQSKF